MITTTGVELKAFYNDKKFWPDDDGSATWHEEEYIEVDGKDAAEFEIDTSTISDTSIIKIQGGIVYSSQFDGNEPSFETYFKRWKKSQSTLTLVISLDKSKEQELLEALKSIGAKVLK